MRLFGEADQLRSGGQVLRPAALHQGDGPAEGAAVVGSGEGGEELGYIHTA